MLAASIFSLLLPALEGSEGRGANLLTVVIGFILGITLLIIIDKSLPHLHALSDVPEGPKSNFNKSTLLFLALTIHNIPEGISIAMPIYYSTNSKTKAFKYTLYSGLAEPFGAFIAFLFLRPYINEIILSITFALVAGIMLYISFAELIPTAKEYKYHKTYLFSIFLGIITIILSHIYSH